MRKSISQKNLRAEKPAVFFVPAIISIAFVCLYVGMQITSIYGGDSGELVSAAWTWGIAHPPGYPLYILISALISHLIPIGTVAWRVGFVSSIPMAISVAVVWLIVYRITRNSIPASLTAILYGVLYPVWLYAIVPEVFGLYALFSSLYILFTLQLIEKPDRRNLISVFFLTGLALAHHHLIILAVVAAFITFFKYYKKNLPVKIRDWIPLLLFFLLGFSVYLYVPVAAMFHPIMDTEHAGSIQGFIALVTRASYGSFRASSQGTGGILNGISSLSAFFQYAYSDIGIYGLLFSIAGLYFLWKQYRKIALFMSVYTGLLLFYFFYAGFPTVNNFQVGTLERFFIVPYQTILILSGVGLAFIITKMRRITTTLLYIVVLLVPVGMILSHYPKLLLLKNDRTLEKYADDVLISVPVRSLFGATQDTTVSAVDYAHYVLNKRQDIIFVNYYLFDRSDYRELLRIHYPKLIFPSWHDDSTLNGYLNSFFAANGKNYVIASDMSLDGKVKGYYIPSGLVYVYYTTLTAIPDRSRILASNEELWKQFSDPMAGILGKYTDLFISDIQRLYSDSAIALAQSYALSGNYPQAKVHIAYALAHETNLRVDQYSQYFLLLIDRGQCAGARDITDALNRKWGDDYVVLQEYHELFLKCYPDDPDIKKMNEKYGFAKVMYSPPQ